MKYLYILLVLCVLVLGGTPAHASTIEEATVNLYCRLKSGTTVYGTSGSGVFVSDRGVILTNAHVAQYFLLASETLRVKGECSVRTGSPAKETYTASVLYLSPAWIDANAAALKKKEPRGSGEGDFALLYVTGAKSGILPAQFPSVPLSFLAAKEGDPVTLAGYPSDGLGFKQIQRKLPFLVTDSTVRNVQGFTPYATDVLTIASSTAASNGVSGGPVLDEDGALAGILAAKSGSLLRAITVSHINMQLMQTGMTLPGMLIGDLATRAQMNRALITPKQIIALRDALLRKR